MAIHYVEEAQGWQVRVRGKKLGYYHKKEDALRAYEEAKRILGVE